MEYGVKYDRKTIEKEKLNMREVYWTRNAVIWN